MHVIYEVIIPFRDRGIDPLRAQNLACVVDMWESYGYAPRVVTDGRDGDAQFNRSAAYNKVVREAGEHIDGFIFAESDMLIDEHQIDEAIDLAEESPGLVIPFNLYHYMRPEDSERIRRGNPDIVYRPQWTMTDGKSIGAINVVSRKTMELVGQFDECFEGNWYDDDAMKIAFEKCAGPTRWVNGGARHLYHLHGQRGAHVTAADRAATARNKARLELYKAAQGPEQIRALTGQLAPHL